MTKIEKLITSGRTIFNLQDLAVLWNESNHRKVVELVKYYLRSGRILPIRRGLYSLNKEYSELEIAQKLYSSYITFHTALSIHGINYQYYNEIHSTSLISRKIVFDNKAFVYHKISENAFYNGLGLDTESNYTIASPERAVCESLLFSKRIGFDHLDMLNPDKLREVAKIFGNLSLEKRIDKLIKTEQIN